MDQTAAIGALSALAQEHRMTIFRTLMRAGPVGKSAGAIADDLGLSGSKTSFHLNQLTRYGLLQSWRVHRHIYYAVDLEMTRELMRFLTEDCCNGHPEICGPIFGDEDQTPKQNSPEDTERA